MVKKEILSKFAPARRSDEKVLKQQVDSLAGQPLLIQALNGVGPIVLILNQERQIVFGNRAFLEYVGSKDLTGITGMRVGEVFGCIHARETELGCGTTDFCKMCGAVQSILSSQKGETDVQECRISREEELGALDLRVKASPLIINDELYTLFTIQDIADEKRRMALERIFFHDLINTATGLKGYSNLLKDASGEVLLNYAKILNDLSDSLLGEIEAQKQLSLAEKKLLEIDIDETHSIAVLERVKDAYMQHNVGRDRLIEVDVKADALNFYTDETLLRRILGNMTKNALEAIGSGETVTLSCKESEDRIRFTVHNPGEMTEEARLQVFQRSFSTKGKGRGLGTYSIKLLSESYLKGKVGFQSSAAEGTLFYAEYSVDLRSGLL